MCVLAYSKSRNLSYRLAQCAQRWFHIPLQVPRGAFSFTFPWILVNFYITQYICVMMQANFWEFNATTKSKICLKYSKIPAPKEVSNQINFNCFPNNCASLLNFCFFLSNIKTMNTLQIHEKGLLDKMIWDIIHHSYVFLGFEIYNAYWW